MNPNDRWMVAGTKPANKGIELCSGDWIAPLDDDDEFSEDHLDVLLNHAKVCRLMAIVLILYTVSMS